MEQKESFRDRLENVTSEGKRRWIFPRQPRGKFYNIRTIFSYIQLILLAGIPFIKINGHPFLLLNFFERKFVIFGLPFGPHDFYLLGLSFISALVFIILFTVIFGRIFCGWLCPQTLFMEMIFRKIEYLIDGNCGEQEKLAKSNMNGVKLKKRIIKFSIFYIVCFVLVHIILSYFTGIEYIFDIIANPLANSGTYAGIIIVSFILFLEYTRFREQLCTMVCPYGRLQGVLLDQNTVVIGYDYKRGEPREHFSGFGVNRIYGDCINCKSCVAVCPTGIDIRNGTQLECVNCTACIDACNRVMKIVKFPTGLIRYTSKTQIETGKNKIFNPRVIGYSIVLAFLITIIAILFSNRKDVEITILRTPGVMAQVVDSLRTSNLYDLKVINKTFNQKEMTLKLVNLPGEIKIIGEDIKLKEQEVLARKFIVILENKSLTMLNTPITLAVYSGSKQLASFNTTFLRLIRKITNEN